MRAEVRFLRRGRVVSLVDAPPDRMLLDWLRLDDRTTGTKEGCAEGDCGACTVAIGRRYGDGVRYEPINACLCLLGQVDGADVVTVEDLAENGQLHPVQQAMVDHHGAQCGFCTPGIVMSLFALHHRSGAERPDRAAINDALAGNLCRCTGYRPIVEAGLAACSQSAGDGFASRAPETARALESLDDKEDIFIGTQERFLAAPASIASLASLYAAHPDATLVAGATDVGLWITKSLRDLPKIVLLRRIKGLDDVEETSTGLVFGATVSHTIVMERLGAFDPDLRELWRRFGSEQVRAAGTIGGNIANGSPIGDAAPALIALDSTLELQHGEAIRSLPLEAFFLDYGTQDRRPGEFVRRVRVRKPQPGEIFRCFKVAKRIDEDISAVLGAFSFKLDGSKILSARVAYGGMAGIPARAAATEAALVGLDLADPGLRAGPLAALDVDFQPIGDHRASASYRRRVARALLEKALIEASGLPRSATRLFPGTESRFADPA